MKKIILSALCIIALASCKKETIEGPQGPAGTNGTNGTNGSGTTGTIIGKLKQYDQYGVPYTTGLNTVTVSVETTTISAVTDATGTFTISNLAPGVYDLALNKPNCGVQKYQQITFPGNGTLYISENICDKATYAFTGGYAKDTVISSVTSIRFNLAYASAAKNRNVIVLYSTANAIDASNPASYDSYQTIIIGANTTSFTNNTGIGSNFFSPFASGSTFYAKIYPCNYNLGGYYDYVLGRQVFTGVGTPLPTFTLTMP